MKTKSILFQMYVAVLLLSSCVTKHTNQMKVKQPNLLVIHTDEHNFRTLSCYQNQLSKEQAFVWGEHNNVNTPYIDRIAHEGAICNRYYASSSVCCPSRASWISGMYPQATGVVVNGDTLSRDLETIGHSLTKAGYSTSYVGKWHLKGGHEKYEFGIDFNGGFQDNRYMMTGGHAPFFHVTEKGMIGGLSDKKSAK